jgi:hypothetical protein
MPCMFACHAIELSGGGCGAWVDAAELGFGGGGDGLGGGRVGGEDYCEEDCVWEEEEQAGKVTFLTSFVNFTL